MNITPSQKKWVIAILIVLIILISILLYMGCTMRKRYSNALTGMWVGDPAWLQKAHLSDMQLYIAPASPAASAKTRQGYLIMANTDGDFLANSSIELGVRFGWKSSLDNLFKTKHDLSIGRGHLSLGEGPSPNSLLPEDVKLLLSIQDGTLIISDYEKVWAVLYKDYEASTTAALAWEAPGEAISVAAATE